MAVVIEIRNPLDLEATYTTIHIQSDDNAAMSSPTDVVLATPIDETTASDLSTGYTSYTDENGVVGTTYYRFRYKNGATVSAWSDVFLAGATVLHTRFRRRMRDTNSNNYFFTDEDLEAFLTEAVEELYPVTWFETYLDTMIVPDGSTEIFNFTTGVTRVSDIEFIDSNGNNIGKSLKWQVRGRMVIFDEAPKSGVTCRVWVEKKFIKLAEVPELWDSLLLNRMRLKAYETLEADRSKFYKYNSVAKPDGGSLPSLDKVISRLELQISRRENQLRRSRKPADIKLV